LESPRALLTAALARTKTRAGATVEFGAASLEAEITIDYSAFRSELVPEPESLGLMLLGIIGLPLIRRRRPQ
jgi:hypothetical protein